MKNYFDSNPFISFAYYIILVYIASMVFEGPIRYILYYYNIVYLLYIRDLFILLLIVGYISRASMTFKVNNIFVIVTFICILHSLIAIFYVNNYLMILFAWKTYILLFCGIIYGHLFFTKLKVTIRLFSILLFCAIIGLAINYFIKFPWEGLEYTIGGVDIEAVRSWSWMGFMRLSGFARTSYDASGQILLLALFLFCYAKNNASKYFLWFMAVPGLLLTTTKGIIVTYFLLNMFLLIYRIVPNYGKIYQKLLFFLLAIDIVLPIFAVLGPIFYDVPAIFESFIMRLVGNWPEVFTLVQQHGNILLGRGLGGMGTSQMYFELDKYNSGDNIFLLFYGNLGLLGIGYLLYLAIIGQSLDLKNELFYYLFIFSFFAYGIVTSCIDNGMFSLFLGVCLGYINSSKLINSEMRKETLSRIIKPTIVYNQETN